MGYEVQVFISGNFKAPKNQGFSSPMSSRLCVVHAAALGLISPEGLPLASWDHCPAVSELLDLMRRAGWVPFVERLENFIARHPEVLEARVTWMLEALRTPGAPIVDTPGLLVISVRPPEERAPEPNPERRAAFMTHFKALKEASPSPRSDPFGGRLATLLPLLEGWAPETFQHALADWAEAVLEGEPSRVFCWQLLATYGGPGAAARVRKTLEGLEPVPGCPWLGAAPAWVLLRSLPASQDWEELESVADVALARIGTQTPDTEGEEARRVWEALRLVAKAGQGRERAVLEALRSAAREPGGLHPAYQVPLRLAQERAEDGDHADLEALAREVSISGTEGRFEQNPIFEEVDLARGRLPRPKPPLLAPVRLKGWGGARESALWKALQADPRWKRWAPGELEWQFQSGPPQWAIGENPRILAPPTADAILDALQACRPSRLDTLDAFLARHPDHREARVTREDWLTNRLPDKDLQGRILADFQAEPDLIRPIPGLQPDPEGLGKAARPVQDQILASLRAWPSSVRSWLALVEWSRLTGLPCLAAQTLQELEMPPHRRSGANAGPLEVQTAQRVLEALVRADRTQEAAQWGKAIWEGGMRDGLTRDYARLFEASRKGMAAHEVGLAQVPDTQAKGFLTVWAACLRRLGLSDALRSLKADCGRLRPGLWESL